MIAPEIIVLSMIVVIMLADIIFSNRHLVYALSQLTLIATAIAIWQGFSATPVIGFDQHVVLDPLASILKFFMVLSTFGVFVYSRQYTPLKKIACGEFHLLVLFSLLGAMVLASANSLLTLYMGLELLSLPLYAMVALQRESERASEAAMKYFVMGALASGILLYGISLIYGATGSFILPTIATIITPTLAQTPLLIFGTFFLIVGIGFKLGLVPFHMWVPDVYQGSPTSVTTFLGTVPKLAGFALLMRLLQEMLPMLQDHWGGVLLVLGVLSLIMGNVVALVQKNIKRMLAYSTISHMGFIFLAVALGTSEGYSAALFYALTYSIMSLGALGVLALLSSKAQEFEYLEDITGFNQRHPWLALMILLLLFSMAGVPPFVGFDAKLWVLLALVHQGHYGIAIFALLMSVIGAYYYLKIVKLMYFDSPIKVEKMVIAKDGQALLSINALAVLIIGCVPGFLVILCHRVFL